MFRNLNPLAIQGIRNLQIPQEKACELAKVGGFEGVDFNVEELTNLEKEKTIDEIKNLPFWNNLRLGGWILPVVWNEDESTFQNDLKNLSHYASIANHFSCNRAYTWVMPFSDKLPFKKNLDLHVEHLRSTAEILKKQNCELGLEYVGPRKFREGHRYKFIYNMKDMLSLIEAIGMNNVGLLLDSFHWYAAEETLRDIEKLDPEQVIYVHVSDAPKGVSIEDLRDDERCLPGETGVINLVGFLRCLHSIGYDGPVTPEPLGLKNMSILDATKATGKALSNLWFAAGL